jgi:hypothetical protein
VTIKIFTWEPTPGEGFNSHPLQIVHLKNVWHDKPTW